MNEASAKAHSLYSVVLHAGGDRGGLALADGGPRPPGLAADVPQRRRRNMRAATITQ